MIQRAIRSAARATGRNGPPVMKWLATPADAVNRLDALGLDALLNMMKSDFWRGSGSLRPFDAEAFYRAMDARCVAADLLRVEENDRALMAPKLAAKSGAMASRASTAELFAVRARMAQIGWLETSWAWAAADAVLEVEYALRRGEPEDSKSIHHQFRVFEGYEAGLLATWETRSELICVPRPGIATA